MEFAKIFSTEHKMEKYNGHESILSVNVLGISNCRRM